MPNDRSEKHLDVYEDRYELHQGEDATIYLQGVQNKETQRRYARITKALEDGYLERKFQSVSNVDFSELSEENKVLLRNMVNGITSDKGRGLVGLAFLQLTIKSITPDQSVRLHKGSTKKGSFSWVEGISMRTLDSRFNVKFLREHDLLKLNKYGSFMTRSLAENYPYSSLYKAEIRGPFSDWIAIVDAIEDGTMPAELGLSYMMALLQNRSERFQECAEHVCDLAKAHNGKSFEEIKSVISTFFNTTDYSARAFEVAMHSFYQAMQELNHLGAARVVPMSQMRSANKKHGNIGDIELTEDGVIVEAWDAKYGKPYLRDELEELRDKLRLHPEVNIAGFVVDSAVDMRRDIIDRKNELQSETGTEILLLSFDEWVNYELDNLNQGQKDEIAYNWLVALVESFAQRRLDLAPIDEPCDAWINDLIEILSN